MVSSRFGLSLLIVALGGVMFLTNLGGARLWDDDEPKNAACGREMLERGDWVVPVFNDELRSHKPVMLYWVMMACYSVLGVSEFTARLPSALASIGTLLLVYHIARMLFDRTVGAVAAMLLASALMFAVLSRAATPDGLLVMFTWLSVFCFIWGTQRAQRIAAETGGQSLQVIRSFRLPIAASIGMYVAMGLAVLTKGPIGTLLPLGSIVLFVLLAWPDLDTSGIPLFSALRRRFDPRRMIRLGQTLRVTSGLAIVLLVTLPWYMAVSYATEGAWLTGFLGTHNVGRFLEPMEGHRGPLYYHVVSVMSGMFPVSCFLPVALFTRRSHGPTMFGRRFLLCWAGMWIVFFSIAATKLPNYVVPAYPALAMLVAFWLVATARDVNCRLVRFRVGLGACATIALALAAGLAVAGHTFFGGDYTLAACGVVLLLGVSVAIWLACRQQVGPATGTYVATALAFTLVALTYVAPRASLHQTSPQVAQIAKSLAITNDDEQIPVGSFRYTKPNLVFYAGRPVKLVHEPDDAVRFLTEQHGVLVMPRDRFAELAELLPPGAEVVASQARFLKPGEEIVVVRANPLVASEVSNVR